MPRLTMWLIEMRVGDTESPPSVLRRQLKCRFTYDSCCDRWERSFHLPAERFSRTAW